MIKIENTIVSNFEGALRGMRNPLESWKKTDSTQIHTVDSNGHVTVTIELGPDDLQLAKKLSKAGSSHRKYLRQIFVCVDITAPAYWWKEFDTYKIGTVANSTSTMHKIHTKELNDLSNGLFCVENLDDETLRIFQNYMDYLENLRKQYLETQDKAIWERIIKLLPSNYMYMRTVTLNYENLITMYYQRRNHKLSEWHVFCKWIEDEIPYSKDLILVEE